MARIVLGGSGKLAINHSKQFKLLCGNFNRQLKAEADPPTASVYFSFRGRGVSSTVVRRRRKFSRFLDGPISKPFYPKNVMGAQSYSQPIYRMNFLLRKPEIHGRNFLCLSVQWLLGKQSYGFGLTLDGSMQMGL